MGQRWKSIREEAAIVVQTRQRGLQWRQWQHNWKPVGRRHSGDRCDRAWRHGDERAKTGKHGNRWGLHEATERAHPDPHSGRQAGSSTWAVVGDGGGARATEISSCHKPGLWLLRAGWLAHHWVWRRITNLRYALHQRVRSELCDLCVIPCAEILGEL